MAISILCFVLALLVLAAGLIPIFCNALRDKKVGTTREAGEALYRNLFKITRRQR